MPKELKSTVPKKKVQRKVSKQQPKPEKDTSTQKKELVATAQSYEQAMQGVYDKRIDVIDKKLGLNHTLTKQPRMSSGLLSVDLMLGNGFVPGFNVFFGAEASAKSTACMTTLRSALNSDIPIRKYFDAEGAIDRRYTGNILGTDSFTDVFGEPGRNGWTKPPRCRYYDSNIIETVFRDMHRTSIFLPDKKYREDTQSWYLVFDRTKEQVALCKELSKAGTIGAPDKRLFTNTGAYWCDIGNNDAPQAVFFLDSLPVMIPEQIDEEEMSDKGLAIEARFLGKYIKLIRGKLRPKGIILLAVNQLRDLPMAPPGALPYYEPGGKAIRFACMAGETRLITDRGMIRADNYERNQKGKILTTDGLQKPKDFGFMGQKQIAEVILANGQMIRCSHDHALSVFNSSQDRSEKFIEARKLSTRSSYVKTLIGQNIWSSNVVKLPVPETIAGAVDHGVTCSTVPTEVNVALARWMGLMTGDGNYCGDSIGYNSIKDECDLYSKLTEEIFNYRPKFRRDKGSWNTSYRVWSIAQTLRMLGMTQSGLKKHVPESIFQSPANVVVSYLAGLFIADGSFGKCASFSTISGQLAHDVQMLLNNLGCESILEKKRSKSGFNKIATGKVRERWTYTVWMTRVGSDHFVSLANFPQFKLRNYVAGKQASRMGFPRLDGWSAFQPKLVKHLRALRKNGTGVNPSVLLRKKDLMYSWVGTLRTSQEREAVCKNLDIIYSMVDDFYKGYRWYLVDSVKLNYAEEPTYDGSMPTDHTIIANGIVCHNSDSRSMWTSRVPLDNFPRWKDNKGLCVEESVEFDGGIDLYAFKGVTNIKNKLGQPFRKTQTRVWIKDGEGEPRGFDPVYDVFNFLNVIGAVEDWVPSTVTDNRKKFTINLKPIADIDWTWIMFKTMILGQFDKNRRLLRAAQELGAPVRFDLTGYCKKLLNTGRTEDMLAHQQRKEEKSSTVEVDIEADDDEE